MQIHLDSFLKVIVTLTVRVTPMLEDVYQFFGLLTPTSKGHVEMSRSASLLACLIARLAPSLGILFPAGRTLHEIYPYHFNQSHYVGRQLGELLVKVVR